jgi:type I restriction enzyme R subunit
MGYTYLAPDEALKLRGGRESEVILFGILEEQLRKMNTVRYKGELYPFTEGNILSAVQALKGMIYDGLVRTNEKVYDLLALGKSLQQSIQGDIKSFTLKYIDWERPENNVYHVTEEFSVERTGRKETYRPDIVLFVNGIPLGVIECKRIDLGPGKEPMTEAISQQIRNQKEDGIPHLFLYSQLLMAVSKNEAKYATTGTPMKFWAVWKEDGIDEKVGELINTPLSEDKKDKLFGDPRFGYVRRYFDELEAEGREVTEQDRAIYALCRPERLLELTYRFTIYDAGDKKVARYQQYFCVKNIMERIRTKGKGGRRTGGVVWHTQGSGKSLTMVMLAKAIALETDIKEHKIVLVTDRVDLDDQIYRTFHHCGKEVEQAKTGRHLVDMLEGHKERIVTTVIDKFEAAVGAKGARNTDPNIFVLVDEGHRGQYGPRHAKMQKALPNACYIGFTGTPVMKKHKNTIETFGGLIRPPYTITQAVEDKAVVPLLYEGRHVAQKVDSDSIDSWFERITGELTREQVADLKKKFTTTDQLNKTEQKVMRVAWDISEHYRDNWHGTGFKAQLVASDKATALMYKRYLDEFGMVNSEVVISAPDVREGEEDIYEENKQEVIRFWKGMMDKFGTEREYNKQLINAFKYDDTPEIIIVVDKLLTGFDAPRNTVLYLTRNLREHTLLQAIARVNRLYEGKEFGFIIDYRGVLENLDHALDLYSALPDFDKEDLANTLTDVSAEIEKLPQRHSVLWDVFKEVKNKRDEEAYESLLADDALRVRFHQRFSEFARTLAIAMSTVKFLEDTPDKKVEEYRRDLKFFKDLRRAVQKRYAEVVEFSEYEPKIKKLLDTYVGTGEVEQITELVNIFDKESFAEEVDKLKSDAAKADTIAHRTKRTIEERMQEDPAFYRKFSELLQDAIRAFREGRISEAEYLRRTKGVMDSVMGRTGDEVPESIKHNDIAKAYYGEIAEVLDGYKKDGFDKAEAGAEAALAIDEIILSKQIVKWIDDVDVKNQMRNGMEDYLFELKEKSGIELTFEDMDTIMDKCLDIAIDRAKKHG